MGGRVDMILRRKIQELIGRQLRRIDVIHHIDGNHSNNDFTNLTIISVAEHNRWHRSLMYQRLVKLITVAELLKGRAMLEILAKVVDIVEEILSKEIEGEREPEKNDRLAALGERLETLALDIKERTSS